MSQEKKIYIATFHHSMNYGAVLQTYALQQTLKCLGFSPTCVDFRLEEHFLEKKKNIRESIKIFLFSLYSIKKKYVFSLFRKRYISLTRHFKNIMSLSSDLFKDAYAGVCGSDQIWNLDIVPSDILSFFLLDFIPPGMKKIAYAASVVNLDRLQEHKDVFQKSLQSFSAISCRENEAKNILEGLSTQKVSVVLDPTLLASHETWKPLEKNRLVKENYVLFYSFGAPKEMIEFTEKIATEKNLIIVHFHKKNHFVNRSRSFANAGPREFITLFRDADFVVTNSFHGTAFSLIYQKDFVVQRIKERASRMDHLATVLGFSHRCTDNALSLNIKEIAPVDYDVICHNLEKERTESIAFLREALNG